jgi:hypothetical protein
MGREHSARRRPLPFLPSPAEFKHFGAFFDEFVAYARPEVGAQLHRQHAHRVQFNGNARYAVIGSILEEVG